MPKPKPKIISTGSWLYTPDSQDDRGFLCKTTANIICDTILKESNNNRLLDFGCGTGYYLSYIQELTNNKLDLVGVEPLIEREDVFFKNILKQDLAEPFNISPGNVMCLEVLEHIPKKYEQTAVENIVKNCNDFLFLSWARVGQGGHGHVNCKNKEDVITLFQNHGFDLKQEITKQLTESARLSWLRNNLLCFRKNV